MINRTVLLIGGVVGIAIGFISGDDTYLLMGASYLAASMVIGGIVEYLEA